MKHHLSEQKPMDASALQFHFIEREGQKKVPSSPLTIGHERSHYPQLIVSYESCFVWHDVRVVEELGNMKFPLKQNIF